MTGESVKSIEVYVEDDLAEAIVIHIASSLGIYKDVFVNKYGAAINVFTVSAGLVLSGQSIINALFVLDGDVYITYEDKDKQLKKVVTGNGDKIDIIRNKILKKITQFNLPPNKSPEQFILHCLHTLTVKLDKENEEIKNIACDIVNAGDQHNLVNLLIEQMGANKEIGLNRIIRVASKSPDWSEFYEPVRVWLEEKKNELHLG